MQIFCIVFFVPYANSVFYSNRQHVAGSSKQIGACPRVSAEARQKMRQYEAQLFSLKKRKQQGIEMSMAARAPPSRQLDALAEAAATLDPTAIPSSKKASTAGSAEYVSSHTVQATIPVLFKGQQREEVDAAVARFIIETGSPFSLVDSNAFFYMVQALVNCNIPSYSPPSSYRVSHKLLDDEYERVQSGLESYFAGIPTTGVTLISDGWSNVNGATLLNFLAHTPAGVVFLWSINTKGTMSCIVCECVMCCF